jgi:hypothetical protein
MKNSEGNEKLLNAVLNEDEAFRASTLERGLAAARRRRTERRTVQVMAPLAVLLIVACAMLSWRHAESARSFVSATPTHSPGPPSVETVPGTPIRVLNDEELFNLFKGRPVALIGEKGHRQFVLLGPERQSAEKEFSMKR